MKKILSIIIFILMATPSWSLADTHTATKNGCWGDPTVWDTASVPENGDAVALSTYVVTAIGSVTTDCTGTPAAAIPATGTRRIITTE